MSNKSNIKIAAKKQNKPVIKTTQIGRAHV